MSGNDTKDCTRSSFELKKALLKRAWEGKSRFTGSEMLARIQAATRRARDIPEGHQETLNDIKATSAAIQDCLLRAEERKATGAVQDPPELAVFIEMEMQAAQELRQTLRGMGVPDHMLPEEPGPALLRLNALEQMRGTGGKWIAEEDAQKVKDALSRLHQPNGPDSAPTFH